MTKHLYIATALFVTASACSAMRRPAPKEITNPAVLAVLTIKRPEAALWIDNETVAVLSEYGCSIHDTLTNKEIKKLTNSPSGANGQQYIALHPNKLLLAIIHAGTLEIVDTVTYNTIYTNALTWGDIPAFNPMDDTIFIPHRENAFTTGISSFNYKNKLHTLYSPMTCGTHASMTLEFHPKKQECLLGVAGQTVRIIQFDNDSLTEQHIAIGQNLSGINKYSPDGTLIAISCTSDKGCLILDPESDRIHWLIDKNNDPSFIMAFHPTSSILATFPTNTIVAFFNQNICYWNARTQQLITTTSMENTNTKSYCDGPFDQRMDFSPDGTKIILALDNQCLVLKVPFKVFAGEPYPLDIQEKCAFALWALKNYLPDDVMLPQDLTRYLTYTLLATSKL